MDVRARIRRKATHDLAAEFWGDVGRGGSGHERSFRSIGGECGSGDEEGKQKCAHGSNTVPRSMAFLGCVICAASMRAG
jgi:hypothetical protein